VVRHVIIRATWFSTAEEIDIGPAAMASHRAEAQAASRVVHPNLVIIYSIYSSGTFGDTPYIVMEYLSGRSLEAEIADGPIAIERTADILGAACAGVMPPTAPTWSTATSSRPTFFTHP
jgi:serine/threonine protein kinase